MSNTKPSWYAGNLLPIETGLVAAPAEDCGTCFGRGHYLGPTGTAVRPVICPACKGSGKETPLPDLLEAQVTKLADEAADCITDNCLDREDVAEYMRGWLLEVITADRAQRGGGPK